MYFISGSQLQVIKPVSDVLLKCLIYSSQEPWKTGTTVPMSQENRGAEHHRNAKLPALTRVKVRRQSKTSKPVRRLMRAAVRSWRMEAGPEGKPAPSRITGRYWTWSAGWPTAQNISQSERLPDKLHSNSTDAELCDGLHHLSGARWRLP